MFFWSRGGGMEHDFRLEGNLDVPADLEDSSLTTQRWAMLRSRPIVCFTKRLSNWQILTYHTVDGRNPAPPKKPCNDDSPVNTNKLMVSHGFNMVEDFVHPQ